MAQDGSEAALGRFGERSLSALVRRTHRAFGGGPRVPAGLSVAEWSVLRVVWRDGSVSRWTLAERLRVGTASLTTVPGTLEREGYRARTRPDDDRRRQEVHLAPTGRVLEPDLLHHGIAVDAAVLDGIDPAEAARRVLAGTIANLDRMRR